MQDDILDPAHDPNAQDTGTNMGAAGLGQPDPAKPAEPEEKVSADGNIIERDGKKYIVFDALKAEREARKTAEQNLAQLAPIVDEYWKARESTRQAAQQEAAKGEKDSPEYLNEVAIAMGYYDETGHADLRRAQAHLNISRREAGRIADKRVQAVEQDTTRDRATANRERLRGATFVDGKPIAEQVYIDKVVEALPEEYLANPQVAALVQLMAAGAQALDQRQKGGQRRPQQQQREVPMYREPMYTEGTTGRFEDTDPGQISALDAAAARARNKTPEQWAKMSRTVNSSRAALDEV